MDPDIKRLREYTRAYSLNTAEQQRLWAWLSGTDWRAPAPPVCSAGWSVLDWARFVTFTEALPPLPQMEN